MKFWIVGKITDPMIAIHAWQFCGFYDTRQNAVVACPDEDYFVSEVEMNKDVRLEGTYISDRYFPLLACGENSIQRMDDLNDV